MMTNALVTSCRDTPAVKPAQHVHLACLLVPALEQPKPQQPALEQVSCRPPPSGNAPTILRHTEIRDALKLTKLQCT